MSGAYLRSEVESCSGYCQGEMFQMWIERRDDMKELDGWMESGLCSCCFELLQCILNPFSLECCGLLLF